MVQGACINFTTGAKMCSNTTAIWLQAP